ncbi:MAG: biotin--[acetyl-CoA-carboxylase] ligase [Desulfobacterium sp.]|nr:biotin--[acetyl-CoA-carboxylase] ligase [Desulfobacterium sp.]
MNSCFIWVTGSCSSAMDVAWQFIAKKSLPEWGSVLALNQWCGRGQLGRSWLSPGGNIYSATRFPLPPPPWENLLSLIVGYSLAKSFAGLNVQMTIKWPNDLILGGKKVGGILTEIKGDSAVVGVGINLLSSPGRELLPTPRVIPAASLMDFGYEFTPLDLWQDLLGQCRDDFTRIVETKIPSGFITEIHDYLAFKNENVHLTDRENKTSTAILMGVAENGGLKLLMNDKIQIIQSGSISPGDGSAMNRS